MVPLGVLQQHLVGAGELLFRHLAVGDVHPRGGDPCHIAARVVNRHRFNVEIAPVEENFFTGYRFPGIKQDEILLKQEIPLRHNVP